MTRTQIISITLCAIICLFVLTGCVYGRRLIYDTTSSKAADILKEAVSLIEAKDAEKLQQMFAVNAQIEQPNLEKQIQSLFAYYDRTSDSVEVGGSEIRRDYDGKGGKTMYGWLSGEIMSETRYLIAARVVMEDNRTPDNIGIWSIYIIRAEDEPDYPEFSYWGEVRTDKVGVYVGIKSLYNHRAESSVDTASTSDMLN